MVLMVFFSSRISPFTSTVIFLDRSPVATAVVTSAMLRTWLVRLPAMKFTLSVRSFHVPATPLTSACPPGFPWHVALPALLAFPARRSSDLGHFGREGAELIDHGVDGVLQLQDLALHIDRDLLGQVARRDGRRHFRNVADLGGEVAGHRVYAVGQVLPRAGYPLDVGLSARLPLARRPARSARLPCTPLFRSGSLRTRRS